MDKRIKKILNDVSKSIGSDVQRFGTEYNLSSGELIHITISYPLKNIEEIKTKLIPLGWTLGKRERVYTGRTFVFYQNFHYKL